MNFPVIKTIDDMLPAIKGHDEFFVAERPYGSIVNYMVALEDSFDCPIRRECRGIIFYPDGKIMSRPYHKFFNLGEKNETRPANLDFGDNPVIMDKLDGSMIRPVYDDNAILLGTKMGITDVAQQAYAWMRSHTHRHEREVNYFAFIRDCHEYNLTPIFEWCSREQRIVVDYPESALILTAVRNTMSGSYISNFELERVGKAHNIPTVKSWDHRTVEQLQEEAAKLQDMEGWVCAWPDGKRVKIKVDWYVTLHKVKESIAREKYVIDAILDDFLDDLKGKMLEQDLKAVEEFEGPFLTGFSQLVGSVDWHYRDFCKIWERDRDNLKLYMEPAAIDKAVRKRIAQEINQHVVEWMRPLLFALIDGKYNTVPEAVREFLKKCTKTQTMIDANRHLWGGARYNYNSKGNELER